MTPRRQDASEPLLPIGPVGVVDARGSEYSLEELLAYGNANAVWNGGTIKTPQRWALKAFETGKFDVIVMMWKRDQEREPPTPLQQCAGCRVAFRPKYDGGKYCERCKANDPSGSRR